MKTALIVTLGTRDVVVCKELVIDRLGADETNQMLSDRSDAWMPRVFGKALFEHYDLFKREIGLPIIQPALDYLRRKGDLPNTIVIVATDQNPAVGKFYASDTVELAILLQRHFPEILKRHNVLNVKTIVVKVTTDVNFLDKMFDFFRGELRKKQFKDIADASKIYLLNQGGIDAINNGLLYSAINLWGEKLSVLCVDERTQHCFPIDFVNQVTQEQNKKIAREYIEVYYYAPLSALQLPDPILAIAAYAESRLHFDWDECLLQLADLHVYPGLQLFVHEQLEQIKAMKQVEDQKELEELYQNAKIKFYQKSYVDFLLRFFRITEELLKAQAVRDLQIVFNPNSWSQQIETCLNRPDMIDLRNFLTAVKLEPNKDIKLEYKNPSITTFFYINRFFKRDALTELYHQLEPLQKLRNQSIGAHNFNPVSLDLIQERLQSRDATIKQVFDALDRHFQITENPFDRINRTLLQLLDKPA